MTRGECLMYSAKLKYYSTITTYNIITFAKWHGDAKK